MPTSSRKAIANRRNARKSTGPITAEGKAKSSRNAITHGLFAQDVCLPGEDHNAFERFRDQMLDSFNPRNMPELALVERIIEGYWKLKRISPAEAQLMQNLVDQDQLDALEVREEELEDLRKTLQYAQSSLSRTRTNKEQCQKECDDAKQAVATAEEQLYVGIERPSAGILLARLIRSQEKSLDMLSRYEQRIENAIHRNLKELRELRKQEMREEEAEMQNEATDDPADGNPCEEQELTADDSIVIEEDVVQENEDEPQNTQRTEAIEDDPVPVS